MIVNDILTAIKAKIEEIGNLNVNIWNTWNVEPSELPFADIRDIKLQNKEVGNKISEKIIPLTIAVYTKVLQETKDEDREAFFTLINEILQKVESLPYNIEFKGYSRDVASQEFTFYGAIIELNIICAGASFEV